MLGDEVRNYFQSKIKTQGEVDGVNDVLEKLEVMKEFEIKVKID